MVDLSNIGRTPEEPICYRIIYLVADSRNHYFNFNAVALYLRVDIFYDKVVPIIQAKYTKQSLVN